VQHSSRIQQLLQLQALRRAARAASGARQAASTGQLPQHNQVCGAAAAGCKH
jgi:hypothetical protein